MLDHYDVRSGRFNLGIRPPAGRRATLGVWRAVKALLNAAADLDAHVYGARMSALKGHESSS